jgi:opacity protein-like surface antigen
MASGNGEAPIGGASGAAPPAVVSAKAPLAVIRKKTPAARFKTMELGLGYAYMSPSENQSKRPGLQGVDASFTIGFSRLGIKADVGYVKASNVLGTGRHSDVLSYVAGPVFHLTTRRNFGTYVHALVGGARVSGPILANGGLILLGGWTTGYAWAVGGGAEYWLTDSMAIRTGADYLRTAYYDSSLVVRGQGNLRTTATVVYYFGMRSRKRR